MQSMNYFAKFKSCWIGICLAICLSSFVLPILWFYMPPTGDFPNHLARYWIMADSKGSHDVWEFYRSSWSKLSTNIGLDLIAATFGRYLPIELLGKIVLLLTFAGPPSAAIILHRTLFGKLSGWQIGFFFMGWTTTAVAGFLSYQVSLALAMLALCAEPFLLRHRQYASIVRVVLGIIVYLFHPTGFVFYLALLFGYSFGSTNPFAGKDGETYVRRMTRRSLLGVSAVAPIALAVLAIFLVVSSHDHAASNRGTSNAVGIVSSRNLLPMMIDNVVESIKTMTSPFLTYNYKIDLLLALPFTGLVGFIIIKLKANVHWGLFLLGVILLAIAPFVPSKFATGAWVDRRLPLMAIYCLLVSVSPKFETLQFQKPLVALLTSLVLLKSVFVSFVWLERNQDIVALQKTIAPIRPMQRVLVVVNSARHGEAALGRQLPGLDYWPAYIHLGGLVVIEKHAFIQSMFAIQGQQPLKFNPPWDKLSDGIPPNPEDFEPHLRAKSDISHLPPDWQAHYDYVLVLYADEKSYSDSSICSPYVERISDDGFSSLYRVTAIAKGTFRKPGDAPVSRSKPVQG